SQAENKALFADKRLQAAGLGVDTIAGQKVMHMGRWASVPVAEVPREYAVWLLNEVRDSWVSTGTLTQSQSACAWLWEAHFLPGGPGSDLSGELRQAAQDYADEHPGFDPADFIKWLGPWRVRQLKVLWLGVDGFVEEYRRQRQRKLARQL